ncbi:MAG: hypothetical protein JWN56_998 [Sphingobacteriales bacterium]|nr:hypothetical protein [Sphingobacteriales bacterium]
MKIGILSHPPTWTTGFGITCKKIALGLSIAGHDVICVGFSFGIITPTKDDQGNFPFRIWKGNQEKDEVEAIGNFIGEENPDAILLNYDIAAVGYFISLLKIQKFSKKLFAHLVIDGFPAAHNLLQAIDELDGIIVPTKASQRYLRSEGLKKVYYAPHGVDENEFFPLNKRDIRTTLDFATNMEKDFIIGVFAKNDERKQIPKVLLAMHHLIFKHKQKNIFLYVHSEIKPLVGTGWDLDFIAGNLKIKSHVIFTERKFLPQIGIEHSHRTNEVNSNKRPLSYLERINMCDVIVNVPFSGGFELCNLEAQACGIPLITINDSGNIKEVVGESALLIEPKLNNIWTNGAVINLIDEIDLANEILRLRNDSVLKQSLRQKGLMNIKKYNWSHLEKMAAKMITAQRIKNTKPGTSLSKI